MCYINVLCLCVCIAANNNKRSLPIYSSHIHTQNIQTISVYCYHSMLCILSRRCRVLHRLLGEQFFFWKTNKEKDEMKHVYVILQG